MLVSELLFESQALLEKLGNLSQLKAGKLLPALMREFDMYVREKPVKGDKRSIEDKHVENSYREIKRKTKINRDIGANSKVDDIGTIKNFAALKKEVNELMGFGVYVDGKCVFLTLPNDLELRSQTSICAWIPSAFQTNPEHRPDKGRKSWDRDPESKIEGDDVTKRKINATDMKAMIEELIKANPGKVTVKTISLDVKRRDKQWARHNDGDGEQFKGKKALAERLAKYKLSKNPTAKDIDDFFKMALGGKNAKIQFDGKSYQIVEGYDSVKENRHNALIFQGKPFKIKYSEILPGGKTFGQTITITMKFFPETMTIQPVSIVQDGHSMGDKKDQKVYNAEAHLMDKLGMAAAKLTPATLTRHFDELIAKTPDAAVTQVKIVQNAELGSEWDDTIKSITNKANRAVAKDRLSKLHDGSVKTRLDD